MPISIQSPRRTAIKLASSANQSWTIAFSGIVLSNCVTRVEDSWQYVSQPGGSWNAVIEMPETDIGDSKLTRAFASINVSVRGFIVQAITGSSEEKYFGFKFDKLKKKCQGGRVGSTTFDKYKDTNSYMTMAITCKSSKKLIVKRNSICPASYVMLEIKQIVMHSFFFSYMQKNLLL